MNDHIGKWERASRLAFSGSVIQAAFNFIGMSLVMYLGYHSTEILINGIMPSVASMSLEDYWEKFAGMIIGAYEENLYSHGSCRYGIQRFS